MDVLQQTKKILVLNGVNLDLLGTRQTDIYGNFSLKDLESKIQKKIYEISKRTNSKFEVSFFQTNSEFEFINALSSEYDGILLNPGAWTHTSIAISDRLACIKCSKIEVHISNLYKREFFRHKSLTASNVDGFIAGLGLNSYLVGLEAVTMLLTNS